MVSPPPNSAFRWGYCLTQISEIEKDKSYFLVELLQMIIILENNKPFGRRSIGLLTMKPIDICV